ncbi:hypothetical protein AB0I37_05765 [Micromonospora purpureochromogenes]
MTGVGGAQLALQDPDRRADDPEGRDERRAFVVGRAAMSRALFGQ